MMFPGVLRCYAIIDTLWQPTDEVHTTLRRVNFHALCQMALRSLDEAGLPFGIQLARILQLHYFDFGQIGDFDLFAVAFRARSPRVIQRPSSR